MKRVKHLTKKNFHTNYFFYRSMLTSFNLKKKNYLNLIYLNKKISKIPFYPEFSIAKNVFNKKNKAFNVIAKSNLEYFFLSNNYNKDNFGLSYYFILNEFNLKKLQFDLNDENNSNLIHFKSFSDILHNDSFYSDINFFLTYNINFLAITEIYKILILLHLHKLN